MDATLISERNYNAYIKYDEGLRKDIGNIIARLYKPTNSSWALKGAL